jgi:hypothetical protein
MLLCDVCFFSDGANSACVGGKVATVHSQLWTSQYKYRYTGKASIRLSYWELRDNKMCVQRF